LSPVISRNIPKAMAEVPRSESHRRDIDGLRAVAVLPVILFHAGLPAFAGGYLGVDIFFVISGFLITGILVRDLAAGRFSIARFYERRARRILPALAVVLIACIPFGLAWLSPNELRSLAESLTAAALSVSNVLFWQQLDYFGPDAERLPLLHTWTLGIEEQFYILFPPLLYALWRLRRPSVLAVLVGLLAASLAAAAWASAAMPSAGFFLLPFRAWELLLGGLVAIVTADGARRSGRLAGLGLALVLLSMAGVPLGLLPGILPIVFACAGTALLLAFTGRGGAVYRLLANPIPVAIGLISYSAYLWHQPLLAFARIRFGELDLPAVLALGAASLLLAWPTWAFVEQPFRRPGRGGSTRPLTVAAVAITALAAIGLGGIATDGVAARKSPAVQAIMASVTEVNPYREACKTDLDEANPTHPAPGCLIDGALPGVVFFGDSHADFIQGGLFPAAQEAGFRFYSVTRSACPPVPGLTRTGPAASDACDGFVRDVIDYAERDDFGVVVLGARWIAGVAEDGFDNGEGGAESAPGDFLTPIGTAPQDGAERQAAVIATYVQSVQDLLAAGLRVVLVYPVPEAGWNVPEELARRRERSDEPVTLSTDHAVFLERQAPILAAFDAIDSPHLYRARPSDVLCDGALPGRCLNSIGDQPLYFDDDHLNDFGARLIAPVIVDAIEAARRDPLTQAARRPAVPGSIE
jgi:peptidoglycan/LPS O-acetylase OafA/YrhL